MNCPAASMILAVTPQQATQRANFWLHFWFRESSRVLHQLRDPLAWRHRKTQPLAALVIGLRDPAREVADAADVCGALRHRDRAARVQQVEGVRGLQHLLVRGQRQSDPSGFGLVFVSGERGEQEIGVAVLEVVGRLLDFVLMVYVAVGEAFRSSSGRKRFPRPAGTSRGVRGRR